MLKSFLVKQKNAGLKTFTEKLKVKYHVNNFSKLLELLEQSPRENNLVTIITNNQQTLYRLLARFYFLYNLIYERGKVWVFSKLVFYFLACIHDCGMVPAAERPAYFCG